MNYYYEELIHISQNNNDKKKIKKKTAGNIGEGAGLLEFCQLRLDYVCWLGEPINELSTNLWSIHILYVCIRSR